MCRALASSYPNPRDAPITKAFESLSLLSLIKSLCFASLQVDGNGGRGSEKKCSSSKWQTCLQLTAPLTNREEISLALASGA